ncbi:MAG TPA: DNA translocase FtsK 4TM domain-containing protein [Planctomycetota bacterium]|nr:DNA translocase FtsK 4TM domain-containing protein [Planctomycetota bacterium]
MQKDSRNEIVAFSGIALAAFLFICLYTHVPEDTLGPHDRILNACGPTGAFLSFHLIGWLGRIGAFGLVSLLGGSGLVLLFRRTIPDPGWKVFGAALMILTLSSFEVAWSAPESSSTLPGGYYGQFFHGVLLSQLSQVGTYLLLGVVMLVAFIISTDAVLYPAFARASGAVLDRARWEAAARGIGKRLAPLRLRVMTVPLPRVTWEGRTRPGSEKAERSERLEEGAFSGAENLPAHGRLAPKNPRKPSDASATGPDPLLDAKPSRAAARAEREAAESDEGAPDASGRAREPRAKEGSAPRGTPETAPAAPGVKPESRPPLKIRVPETRENTPRKRSAERPGKQGPYQLPPLDLINAPSAAQNPLDRTILEQTAAKIEETLKHFKIDAHVVEVQKGPTITQYEVSLAAGIKVHKIINLSDDLAMALKAPSIRIVAPIPGKSTVGVEVPNKVRSTVGLRELLESQEFRDEDYKLPLALGKDVAGSPVIGDLGEMPHLLIAGSTGSGKSVAINSIIINLLLTRTPDEVKLILVDPKMVELAQFENIPHLLTPVVTDMKKAPAVLSWMVDKMEERYELLAVTGVRHLSAYNALGPEKLRERLQGKVDEADMGDYPVSLPYMVVIIDELADLMMTSSKEVEASITRLSQKSRAVGIHVILATQRPSVDVITGLIKANMPSRVSVHVASQVDSRTILDRNGAEKLLGKGDLLYLPPGTSALLRVQGTFISDKEIRDVVRFAVQQAEPQFSPELGQFGLQNATEGGEEDELYEPAVRIVLSSQRGSVTLLQRQLQIGYTRASRLMEIMHEHGLVGPFKGSKAREVYYTIEEWEEANAKNEPRERGRSAGGEEPGAPAGGAEKEGDDLEGGDLEDDDLEDGDLEDGDLEDSARADGGPGEHDQPGLPEKPR